jgi:hypothetical protein
VEHIRVTVGEHDLSKRETPPSQEVRVRRLVLYPGYQCERFSHDIALLELDGAVGWSESVWPACLPQGSCPSCAYLQRTAFSLVLPIPNWLKELGTQPIINCVRLHLLTAGDYEE